MKEHNFLKDNYLNMTDSEIGRILGRSKSSILQYRRKNGMKKPERSELGYYPKGNTPWNRGVSHNPGGNSHLTRFKKGQEPHNTRKPFEIYERDDHGKMYLYIKIPDRGCMPLHKYVWEQANGPIPKNHVVRIIGDPLNVELGNTDNLEMVSRAENMKRNLNREKAQRAMKRLVHMEKMRIEYGLPLQTDYGKRLKV